MPLRIQSAIHRVFNWLVPRPSIHSSLSTELNITQTYVSLNQPYHDRNNVLVAIAYISDLCVGVGISILVAGVRR